MGAVAGEQMPVPIRVTVSYRRSDSPYAARGIRTRLAEHFGQEHVFMDIDSIPFGVDYREPIAEALEKTNVLVVIIGPKWFGPREAAKARIFDNNDPVRLEVAAALAMKRMQVMPLLVDGAVMPAEADLPDDLKDLAYRNASPIDSGRDFDVHIERVIRSIEEGQRLRQAKEEQRRLAEHAESERLAAEDAEERDRQQRAIEEHRRRLIADEAERKQLADLAERQRTSARVGGGRLVPAEREREQPVATRPTPNDGFAQPKVVLVRGALLVALAVALAFTAAVRNHDVTVALTGAGQPIGPITHFYEETPAVLAAVNAEFLDKVAAGLCAAYGIVASVLAFFVASPPRSSKWLSVEAIANVFAGIAILFWSESDFDSIGALGVGLCFVAAGAVRAYLARTMPPGARVVLMAAGAFAAALGVFEVLSPKALDAVSACAIYDGVSGLALVLTVLSAIRRPQIGAA